MSDEQDPLIALATPPAVSDRFEIQDLSPSNALAHPVLGPSLGRMSEIVDRLRANSLVLFNDPFKSTNVRESSEIVGQIVKRCWTARGLSNWLRPSLCGIDLNRFIGGTQRVSREQARDTFADRASVVTD
jgi:hypothetical protein